MASAAAVASQGWQRFVDHGSLATYNVDGTHDGALPTLLTGHPITAHTTEMAKAPSGAQVAIGADFLAYALRGGQVRVLDLQRGTRALLRGHEAAISNLQFCGSELLCTASDDGVVLLRVLSTDAHAQGGISVTTLLRLDTLERGALMHLACSPSACCVAAGQSLLCIDLVALAEERLGPDELRCDARALPACISLVSAGNVTGLAFAPEGELLAQASSNGNVQLWETHARAIAGSPAFSFSPVNSEVCAVTSVTFTGRAADGSLSMVCGVEKNRALYFGRLDVGARRYTPLQRFEWHGLQQDARLAFRLLFDGATCTLLLACQQQPRLYLLALGCDGRVRGVTEHTLPEPIASMTSFARAVSQPLRLACTHPRSVVLYTPDPVDAAPAPAVAAPDTEATSMLVAMKAELADFKEQLARERPLAELAEAERQTKLLAALTDSVTNNLERRLGAIIQRNLDAVGVTLQDAAASTHAARVETSEADMRAQRQLTDELKAHLTKEVRATVQNSIAPRIELACRDMFSQIHESFKGGVERLSADLSRSAANDDATAALVAQLDQIIGTAADVTARLSDVASGVQRIVHASSPATQDSPARASEHRRAADSTKTEISRLLADHSFDAAFTLALSSSNVQLLSWLCAQVSPDDVLGATPALGQGVMLSLVQQLGCDLRNEPSTKAAWIREAALSLDFADPQLQSHIRAVLSTVQPLLEHEAGTSSHAAAAVSDLRLCSRVVAKALRGL